MANEFRILGNGWFYSNGVMTAEFDYAEGQSVFLAGIERVKEGDNPPMYRAYVTAAGTTGYAWPKASPQEAELDVFVLARKAYGITI